MKRRERNSSSPRRRFGKRGNVVPTESVKQGVADEPPCFAVLLARQKRTPPKMCWPASRKFGCIKNNEESKLFKYECLLNSNPFKWYHDTF